MRVLTTIFALLVFTASVQAQNQISINASSEVMVPADNIAFQINLNAEAPTPQEAYDLHKEREKVLVNQLKKYDIKEEDINFDPISINKHYDNSYQRKEWRVRTQQNVVVTLNNFDIYENIQVTLIENNFDEFSGNFLSSETKQGEDEALKKALKTAREKADIIASETGLAISGIKNISYSYSQRPPRPMSMDMMRSKSAESSLLQFDQTVSVSASVSVTYTFKESK
jgi:uncharacterized protein YggE